MMLPIFALFLATAMLARGAYVLHDAAQRGRSYLPMHEGFFWTLTGLLFFGSFLAPAIGFVFLPWPWVIVAGVAGQVSLHVQAFCGAFRAPPREPTRHGLAMLACSSLLLTFAFYG